MNIAIITLLAIVFILVVFITRDNDEDDDNWPHGGGATGGA